MTNEETQKRIILVMLLDGRTLTPNHAWYWAGCSKLSTRCSELIRENKFPIQKEMVKVKNRHGKQVQVMSYFI